MIRSSIRRRCLAAAFLLFAAAAILAAAETSPEIEILRPAAGEPLVGRIVIEIAVRSSARPSRVDLEIDGRVVHSWLSAPFELSHDFGVSGHRRLVRARAVWADGRTLEAVVESPAIRIDERVDLELQQLYVTVENRRGKRRLDLPRDDFSVVDGGRKQKIVTFAAGDVPFTAVLLLDASRSMRGSRLVAALDAARRFVAGMSRLDRAQLIAFSERVLAATAVERREALVVGFSTPFSPAGGTAIRDHLFLALRLLEARHGRRAVVLLSDGWDRLSVLASEDLWSAAERSQSTVYWVRLAGDEPTPSWRAERVVASGDDFAALRFRFNPSPSSWADDGAARKAYRRLEEVVKMSGGRILTADNVEGLEGAVSEVLAELREQYALGYYPEPRAASGEWRAVRVELARGQLKIRTRSGYIER